MQNILTDHLVNPEQTSFPLQTPGANRAALIALGQALQDEGYRFTTVTPITHERVNARVGNEWALSLQDVFGWSRPFKTSGMAVPVPSGIVDLMCQADILLPFENGWKSRLRASTLDEHLYFHSAYPTDETDSIFFGPDTYRFIRALKNDIPNLLSSVCRAIDIGCGAGPGAVTIATYFPQAEVFAADINDAALHLTAVNAELAKLPNLVTRNSNLFSNVAGEFDLIVANPPYLVDSDQRAYRHGGGQLGAGLSLAIVEAGLKRLRPNGSLLLYTGSAIRAGNDVLLQELHSMLDGKNCTWSYEEIDPDVFGEELEEMAYAGCDRLAAVWMKLHRMEN